MTSEIFLIRIGSFPFCYRSPADVIHQISPRPVSDALLLTFYVYAAPVFVTRNASVLTCAFFPVGVSVPRRLQL